MDTWNAVATAQGPVGHRHGHGGARRLHQGQLRDGLGQPGRRRPAGGGLRRGRERAARARPRPRLGQRLRPERRRSIDAGQADDRRHVPDHQRVAHRLRPPVDRGPRARAHARPRALDASASPSARTARWRRSSRARCRRCIPFSIAGNERRSLEADDVASLSELYPEPSFTTTTGTITGTVTRCGTGEPVLGANVRAINVANPTIQLTRVTGFDGRTDGSYTIHGVPPGDYDIVVEPLAGDDRLPRPPRDVHARRHRLHAGVPQRGQGGRLRAGHRPQRARERPGRRERDEARRLQGRRPRARARDRRHRQHGPGDRRDQDRARHDDRRRSRRARSASRKTTIVTFDDSATINDGQPRPRPAAGRSSPGSPRTSTPDCPEGSNAALMTAGRQLGRGGAGRSSSPTPTATERARRATSVDALYASKGAAAVHAAVRQLPAGAEPRARAAPRRRRRPAARREPDEAPPTCSGRELAPHVQRGDPVLRRRLRLPPLPRRTWSRSTRAARRRAAAVAAARRRARPPRPRSPTTASWSRARRPA